MTKTVAILKIEFQDYMYFTSREERRHKITIPILHNIALQYVLRNVNSGELRLYSMIPHYIEDFKDKKHDYYIYPAISKYSIASDRLWASSTGVVFGWQSDQYRTFSNPTSTNMLQCTSVKLLDPENEFFTFIISESLSFDELKNIVPKYARIGKMRSKIKIEITNCDFQFIGGYTGKTNWWLNPNDLPKSHEVGMDCIGNYLDMLPNGLMSSVYFQKAINAIKLKLHNHKITIPVCEHFQRVM